MKYDSKLPEITGTVGFVIANTLVALSIAKPGKYPMDFIRVHLLLYAVKREIFHRHKRYCFDESFVVLSIDDQLMPILPSVAAIYGLEKPFLIPNAKGISIVVHLGEPNDTGDAIRYVYENSINMSNEKILKKITAKTRFAKFFPGQRL